MCANSLWIQSGLTFFCRPPCCTVFKAKVKLGSKRQIYYRPRLAHPPQKNQTARESYHQPSHSCSVGGEHSHGDWHCVCCHWLCQQVSDAGVSRRSTSVMFRSVLLIDSCKQMEKSLCIKVAMASVSRICAFKIKKNPSAAI
jgi:hypothetical protein